MRYRCALFLFFLFFSCLGAGANLYPFTSFQDRQHFHQLTSQLRCLICQNKNTALSNEPFAQNLRGQIYAKIQEKKSNEEIIHELETRYKNYISFKPIRRTSLDIFLLILSVFLFLFIFFLLVYMRVFPKIPMKKFLDSIHHQKSSEALEDELDP